MPVSVLLALALHDARADDLLQAATPDVEVPGPGAIGVATPPAAQIWHGTTVGPTDFQAVVALYLQDPANTFCSGTLIDPSWVLTAAHCVADAQTQRYLADGFVAVGIGRATPFVARVQVDEAVVHASYNRSAAAGAGHDIALVHLARPVTSIDPIPYNTVTLDDSYVGLPLTVVGYGITTDNAEDSGTKRRSDTQLIGYEGIDLLDSFNGTVGRNGQPVSWDSSSNACNGDSGGATLAQDGGGNWVLVGVNDVVFPQCAHGATGSTRTDLYDAWIQGQIGSGASGGGTIDTPDTPDWFTLQPTATGGRLKAPDLGTPPAPGDVADYPTVDVAPDTGGTAGPSGGCATVDGRIGLLALTGLLARRRRR